MHLIYLDTETTDSNPQARLVQLAYKNTGTGDEVNTYFKPPVPISIGAMAVHHITNKIVADKPAFADSQCRDTLIASLRDGIVVAHNALFDIGILKNEGVIIDNYIDTLRVSRHLIDSESYALQYLRYLLEFDITAEAHDAWGDILVLELLGEYLKTQIKEKYDITDDQKIIEKMIELTHLPVSLPEFTFGKYRGKTFAEVARDDQGYLSWLYTSETSKDAWDQNDDLVYTLKNYIEKI